MPSTMSEQLKTVQKALIELTQQTKLDGSLMEALTSALQAEALLTQRFGPGTCLHVRVRSTTVVATTAPADALAS